MSTHSAHVTLTVSLQNRTVSPRRGRNLDLSTPRPCFRSLNDLACLFNASKHYKKGISLEELMLRIEAALAEFRKANQIAPSYRILYNIAQAYRQANDCKNSVFFE